MLIVCVKAGQTNISSLRAERGIIMAEPKKATAIILRGIDPEMWTKFRVLCLQAGISAQAKVDELIRREVERAGGKP
jgi:hypothetical protein